MTVVVARSTDARAFGAFALIYGTYLFALGVSNAVGSEPLVIRYGASTEAKFRCAVRSSVQTTLLVGIASALVTISAGAIIGGLVGAALLALAVVLPGLLLQDAWRLVFFAQGRPSRAATNDLVWCFSQAATFGYVLSRQGRPSVVQLVLAWGAGAAVAALFGMAQIGLVPIAGHSRRWLKDHRDLIPQLLLDFLGMTAGLQITLYVVALVASLAEVAGLRASITLLGPLNVMLTAARVFALPEGVRMKHEAYGRLFPAARSLAILLMGIAAIWGFATFLLPSSVGRALLGDSWDPARSVLPSIVLLTVARAATFASMVGLRVLDAPNRILTARVVSTPLLFAGGVAGATVGGGAGAAIGLAAAQWLCVWVWWRQFGKGYREGGTSQPAMTGTGGLV